MLPWRNTMATAKGGRVYLGKTPKSATIASIGFLFLIEVSVERANHKLRDLLALWTDKCAGRAMPSRADLAVSALKPWLGNLALIDIQGDGGAVFRLCGTNLHARFGGEMTRRDVSELSPAIGESFCACLEWACSSKTPTEAIHERVINGVPATFSELHLPLSDDAIHVHTLLFASYPVTRK
jgi:hypothetical protein